MKMALYDPFDALTKITNNEQYIFTLFINLLTLVNNCTIVNSLLVYVSSKSIR